MAALFLCGRSYAPAVLVGAALTSLDSLRHGTGAASPLALVLLLASVLFGEKVNQATR